jgi:hypothetical protein
MVRLNEIMAQRVEIITRFSDSEAHALAIESDLLSQIERLLSNTSSEISTLKRPTDVTVNSFEILHGPGHEPKVSKPALDKFPAIAHHLCWWDEKLSKEIIKIKIQPRNEKRFQLTVDLMFDTIQDVRSLVLDEMPSLSPTFQIFQVAIEQDVRGQDIFGMDTLENSKKLSDYSIKGGDVLYLREPAIINVEWRPCPKKTVHVDLSETVGSLKATIAKERDVPAESLLLSYKQTPQDYNVALRDCGITSGSTVSVKRNFRTSYLSEDEKEMQIMVRLFTGKTIAIFARGDDLVMELKQEIERKAMVKTKFQRLLFSGKQLQDWQPISKYNIRHGSTVILTARLFSVDIKDIPTAAAWRKD